jgi:hypothetical protein
MLECGVLKLRHNYSETSTSQIQMTNCLLFIYMEHSNMFCTPATPKFSHVSPKITPHPTPAPPK